MSARKSGYSLLYIFMSFVVGCILAGIVAVTLSKPSPKTPAVPGQTSDAEATAEGEEDVIAFDPALMMPSWNADSRTLAKLVDYVEDVCNPVSRNYVEPADRIATFDMDGTVLCEKAPVYVDYCMLMHRVLEDPSYEADAETIAALQQIRANADQGFVDGDLNDAKNSALVKAFAGMTQAEFADYVTNFIDTTEAEGFSGMVYGQSFYHPMAEVINYLRAHEFNVYFVSASEREVARAIVAYGLGFEPDHVIGTDIVFAATGQGDVAPSDYTVTQDDELVLTAEMLPEVGKGNKVVYIQREIGKRPILAFGNSSGDFAMLNYAQGNPEHKGMGVLIVADDTVREYGEERKAASMREEADGEGWLAVSMRDDWATIYGEGVEKTALPADLELADAA